MEPETLLKILITVSLSCGIGAITGWAGVIALFYKLRAERRKLVAETNKTDADALKTSTETAIGLLHEVRTLHDKCKLYFEQEQLSKALSDNLNSHFRQIKTIIRELLSMDGVAYWEADAEMRKTAFNEAWLGLTGMSFEEARGDGWKRCVFAEDLPKVLRSMAAAKSSGSGLHGFRFRIVNQVSNEIITVESSIFVLYNLDGTIFEFIGRKVRV